MGAGGAGWPEIFGPAEKMLKVCAKKHFGAGNLFGGSVAPQKPKNGDFRPKMAILQNFRWPEIGVAGAGRAGEIFPDPKYAKVFPKKFSWSYDH